MKNCLLFKFGVVPAPFCTIAPPPLCAVHEGAPRPAMAPATAILCLQIRSQRHVAAAPWTPTINVPGPGLKTSPLWLCTANRSLKRRDTSLTVPKLLSRSLKRKDLEARFNSKHTWHRTLDASCSSGTSLSASMHLFANYCQRRWSLEASSGRGARGTGTMVAWW